MGRASAAKKNKKSAGSYTRKKVINWFPIVVSGITVAVVAMLAVLTVFMNQLSREPAQAPQSNVTVAADIATTIVQETGAIRIGEASDTLEEYADFGCSHCLAYHQQFGELVKGAVADEKITLEIYPVAFMDNAYVGSQFSTRGANALYCVASEAPNSIFEFQAAVYANKPEDGKAGPELASFVKIAENVGASAAASCILNETYNDFVKERSQAINRFPWFTGTPTLRWNENVVTPESIPMELQRIVDAPAS